MSVATAPPSPASAATARSVQLGLQRAQVAHGAHGLDAVVGDHRDPGAVVAAVLELLQAGEQQLLDGGPPSRLPT